MTTINSSTKRERPLSPHLQIYRPQLTSMLSIVHRGTGCALAVGAFAIVIWLLALAGNPDDYALVREWAASPIGCVLIFGFGFALLYHLLNGIRHLAWDAGWGLDIKTTYQTGWAVVALAFAGTAGLWVLAARAGGAA
ncbi:MAG: succinate dehydrogenase, cytochrome b556 subunit [Pseudomarimonas sp.]